ncbi:sigma factor [Micromonospora olivasterospora]|uniref:DNA-directed RNA polymerase specialized sigma24 family protein n=1 Tax=Micromonospora olivasterospora TaxID=1880 RepID=A0A562II35_MICOL|nr:sigma factor [Micromonospora olivasterospora]TWH70385.1 DNA-directed RNA polymerase specialized sigma24 family protein [Micromonospora olivasterospora]
MATTIEPTLVRRAAEGDRAAMGDLLAEFHPRVVRYCRARLGRVGGAYTTADDVAQEVCLAVMRALPRYREQGKPFSAFVFAVAAHTIGRAHDAVAAGRLDAARELAEQARLELERVADPAAVTRLRAELAGVLRELDVAAPAPPQSAAPAPAPAASRTDGPGGATHGPAPGTARPTPRPSAPGPRRRPGRTRRRRRPGCRRRRRRCRRRCPRCPRCPACRCPAAACSTEKGNASGSRYTRRCSARYADGAPVGTTVSSSRTGHTRR